MPGARPRSRPRKRGPRAATHRASKTNRATDTRVDTGHRVPKVAPRRDPIDRKGRKGRHRAPRVATGLPRRRAEMDWRAIRATHIDRSFRRLQVQLSDDGSSMRGYFKLPSARMTQIGCDACSGPHHPRSLTCRAGKPRDAHNQPPPSWMDDAGTETMTGSYDVYDLKTHARVPGRWSRPILSYSGGTDKRWGEMTCSRLD